MRTLAMPARVGCLAVALAASLCRAHADHAVDAPSATSVTIEVRDGLRHITSSGLPDHEPGRFPNRNNPNAIAPQRYAFRVPVTPQALDQPREVPRGSIVGVAVNGVVFDPGTAEFWRDDPALGWRMEAIGGPRNLGLDRHHAHVQPSGAYHYHGVPTGLIEKLGGIDAKQPLLIGWAADGFPIYAPRAYRVADDPESGMTVLRSSYRLKAGARPASPDGPGGAHDGAYTRDFEYVAGSGDLDECNGRVGVTPEFPRGTYYYVVTDQFPFVPRLLRGTADASFLKRAGPPAGRAGERPGRRGSARAAEESRPAAPRR